MSLIWYEQGRWFLNSESCELYNGDKIINESTEKIFDLSVCDPNNSDDMVARVIKGEKTIFRCVSNRNSDICTYHVQCPYLELKYNSKASLESEHPLKIMFYAKANNINDCGLISSVGASKEYFIHVVKIGKDIIIFNDTGEIRYPFNFTEWFKFEMEFDNEYTVANELTCNIKINDYCLGNIKWASPQRYPLRFYMVGMPTGCIDINDLKVYRKIEETKPFKPIMRILRKDNENIATLTADAVINEDSVQM